MGEGLELGQSDPLSFRNHPAATRVPRTGSLREQRGEPQGVSRPWVSVYEVNILHGMDNRSQLSEPDADTESAISDSHFLPIF